MYGAFFAIYAAAITHVGLFHRSELFMGFKNFWRTIRQKKKTQTEQEQEDGEYKDVHNKLMAAYPEGNTLQLLSFEMYQT